MSVYEGEDVRGPMSVLKNFSRYMITKKEFRSLFYYRCSCARVFSLLAPPSQDLYIDTRRIGPGLFLQHCFSTIIVADSIGENCWINQQVTIGYSKDERAPIIGDNVNINAGAKVIGSIRIGNNVKIGANAVVVKDVPDNCTVVGVPAYIVRRDGKSVRENL